MDEHEIAVRDRAVDDPRRDADVDAVVVAEVVAEYPGDEAGACELIDAETKRNDAARQTQRQRRDPRLDSGRERRRSQSRRTRIVGAGHAAVAQLGGT